MYSKFVVNKKNYHYVSLSKISESYNNKLLARFPVSIKIIIENLARHGESIKEIMFWGMDKSLHFKDILYRPERVLMQDFTGVPAVVDLASMRDAVFKKGIDPNKVNPSIPVDLVIDHSLIVDYFGSEGALHKNIEKEMSSNVERYNFLKWSQKSFQNFSVIPPGNGICHQINLEYLSKIVMQSESESGEVSLYPDTLIGTDSHTTMVNGISVLAWGVGGIEAEAVMLGQPISMLIPEVVGVKVTGKLNAEVNATDLVLTITQMLREKNVVQKFVEFYGEGLENLSVPDRATISNMAPEYGATVSIFPIDDKTIEYMHLTGKSTEQIEVIEKYAKLQGLWARNDVIFNDIVELNLSSIKISVAGPKRPQDRLDLSSVPQSVPLDAAAQIKTDGLSAGSVVLAAVTSCTNTSNPSVMVEAGLVARNIAKRGLKVKKWVKTSLAPGSKVVSEYLHASGLNQYLDVLGFNVVGYGCTTCIGNSGPLLPEVEREISDDLQVASVLSGNRNFEGRIHPKIKLNYLMSPALVIVYAIVGSVAVDITKEAIGVDVHGNAIFLHDVWPNPNEVQAAVSQCINTTLFKRNYSKVNEGTDAWQDMKVGDASCLYKWDDNSSYIKQVPYFDSPYSHGDICNSRMLALFGDSITTDHISPAGTISSTTSAAKYLLSKNVEVKDFNSYGSRRGNHEIMVRGTFANIRVKNRLVNREGGYTLHMPSNAEMSIYDAAMLYKEEQVNLIIIAGKDYGMGSSRDWAAKGTSLLGVKAVIAKSFERIHRSNLIGMGVLPLTFKSKCPEFDGTEIFDIKGIKEMTPRSELVCKVTRVTGEVENIQVVSCIKTDIEMMYFKQGGILKYVFNDIVKKDTL